MFLSFGVMTVRLRVLLLLFFFINFSSMALPLHQLAGIYSQDNEPCVEGICLGLQIREVPGEGIIIQNIFIMPEGRIVPIENLIAFIPDDMERLSFGWMVKIDDAQPLSYDLKYFELLAKNGQLIGQYYFPGSPDIPHKDVSFTFIK